MGHSEHHKPFKCEEILLDLVPYPPGPVKAWAAGACMSLHPAEEGANNMTRAFIIELVATL